MRIAKRLDALRTQLGELHAMERLVEPAPDRQISLTDPDARAMATRGKGTETVGYNVQAVVDTEHRLIVAHAVTNVGHDLTQLAYMGRRGQVATGHEALNVLADRGHFSGEGILACDQAGIAVTLPDPLIPGAKAEGRSANRTSSTRPRRTPIVARRASRSPAATRTSKVDSRYAATGQQPATAARSKRAARQPRSGA